MTQNLAILGPSCAIPHILPASWFIAPSSENSFIPTNYSHYSSYGDSYWVPAPRPNLPHGDRDATMIRTCPKPIPNVVAEDSMCLNSSLCLHMRFQSSPPSSESRTFLLQLIKVDGPCKMVTTSNSTDPPDQCMLCYYSVQ
jgi:hypothetical protein